MYLGNWWWQGGNDIIALFTTLVGNNEVKLMGIHNPSPFYRSLETCQPRANRRPSCKKEISLAPPWYILMPSRGHLEEINLCFVTTWMSASFARMSAMTFSWFIRGSWVKEIRSQGGHRHVHNVLRVEFEEDQSPLWYQLVVVILVLSLRQTGYAIRCVYLSSYLWLVEGCLQCCKQLLIGGGHSGLHQFLHPCGYYQSYQGSAWPLWHFAVFQ